MTAVHEWDQLQAEFVEKMARIGTTALNKNNHNLVDTAIALFKGIRQVLVELSDEEQLNAINRIIMEWSVMVVYVANNEQRMKEVETL